MLLNWFCPDDCPVLYPEFEVTPTLFFHQLDGQFFRVGYREF